MCETIAGVTSETLAKAWLDSLNERPEGGVEESGFSVTDGLGWVGCQMFVAMQGIWRGRSLQHAARCEKAWHSQSDSLLGTVCLCAT